MVALLGLGCGDTNPPTMDTWWYYQMEGLDSSDGVSLNDNGWDVFKQPSGRSSLAENVDNLPEGYYDTQGRSEEYIRVYIDGEYGLSSAGQLYINTLNQIIIWLSNLNL